MTTTGQTEELTRHYAIYIEQIDGNTYDSYITLNGKRIGGTLGPLHAVMINATTRLINAAVDREWYDPWESSEVVLDKPCPPKS